MAQGARLWFNYVSTSVNVAKEADEITFLGCSDHVNRFSGKDEEGGGKLVTEKPELRTDPVSTKLQINLDRKNRQRCSKWTYVHGVVFLKSALICLRLAHEDDNRVSAAE